MAQNQILEILNALNYDFLSGSAVERIHQLIREREDLLLERKKFFEGAHLAQDSLGSQATREVQQDASQEPIAFEFYDPTQPGKGILDYHESISLGNLLLHKGFLKRALYAHAEITTPAEKTDVVSDLGKSAPTTLDASEAYRDRMRTGKANPDPIQEHFAAFYAGWRMRDAAGLAGMKLAGWRYWKDKFACWEYSRLVS